MFFLILKIQLHKQDKHRHRSIFNTSRSVPQPETYYVSSSMSRAEGKSNNNQNDEPKLIIYQLIVSSSDGQ